MTVYRPRIIASGQILAHVPDLVFSGSKPAREITADPLLVQQIAASLRSDDLASRYLPNQVFIGAEPPRALLNPGMPWWSNPLGAQRLGRSGALFSQDEFLAALAAVDSSGLLNLRHEPALQRGTPQEEAVASLSVTRQAVDTGTGAVELIGARGPLGSVSWGYPGDEALSPTVVLENLATKASGALALAHVLRTSGIDPQQLDLVISCSEEAIGDRYQRGGGNLGKAIAEAVGAGRSSGFDVKNFCAGPIPALVVASSLVAAGVANTVVVVAGGSLPKLGMKFQGHLKSDMPVLEDCLGGVAAVISAAGDGPIIRHDAVGMHSVAAGGSNQQIFNELVFDPLEKVGLKATDVDMFGTELHNPELTEPQGSGNVPMRNYRMLSALAARRGHISTSEVEEFLNARCVAGFAPTQGHIASAICLLPHVFAELNAGRMHRAQLIAKGSLFLGRMSGLSDGMSVLVES